jgi:hypothetical protein
MAQDTATTFEPRTKTPAGNSASAFTRKLDAELNEASQSGKSERTLDRLRVLFHAAQLVDDGIIRDLQIQHGLGHPRVFTILARGFRGTRAYTLSELEAFVHGADAARNL